ncbi:7515_t:CDS:2 [Gigaspora margarita]|uniref:7515_t:CDS:1 n=1 Tax=Gigaspora margarita TaxID=4874 RepID=A0ABN7ULF9_GIGMA|nr:7515_t:CDS:2 [Gigaspora margarita]
MNPPRHENAKHNDCNTPPIQQYILPENAINEWKKMLVHAIHKRLPLAFRKTEKQVIKFPYMERPGSYQTISPILDDQRWGVWHYKYNQVSYVVQLIQTTAVNSVQL